MKDNHYEYCPSCNNKMKMTKNFGYKKRGKKKYSIKRFSCELCDIHQTKFGSGLMDSKVVKDAIIKGGKI